MLHIFNEMSSGRISHSSIMDAFVKRNVSPAQREAELLRAAEESKRAELKRKQDATEALEKRARRRNDDDDDDDNTRARPKKYNTKLRPDEKYVRVFGALQ